jgi:hypothetical protein
MKDMNWPERVAYLENQLADSDRENQRLSEFIKGLPDGDETSAQLAETQRFPHGAPAVQEVMCEACKGEGAYAGTDRICLTCSGLGTLRYKGSAPAEWPYAQAMCREDLPNAEIVALRVKFYNVERDLEDSEADNVRLRGLLTRIHGIAAEPRPVNTEVRLENIACIASGERDATSAQLAETQRFPHSAETESISRAMCREDLPFLAATAQPVLHGAVKFYWIQGPLTNYGTTEKGFNGEVRVVSEADFNIAVRLLQKIMARCADLLDEDQFNELDAMTRTTVTVTGSEP